MSERRDFHQRLLAILVIVGLFVLPIKAISQDFPTKPITIYCGYEAGATVDLTTRGVANEAEKVLGVPVVVENHAGGSGAVAATLLASKKPDGYILAAVPTAQLILVSLMVPVTFDPLKDFTFIATSVKNNGGICVRNDSPFKTLQDLIEYARKNPRVLSYSSTGLGGPTTLVMELLAKQANVKFKHVPYKGGAPATTALIGGHVDFTAGAGIHRKYVKQGIFRMLAVTLTDERDPEFPDIPTMKDLGYEDLPPNTHMVFAPKGLPDPISKKLEAAFVKAADSPEFRKLALSLGLQPTIKNRHRLETGFPSDFQYYAKFLKEIGLEKKK